MLLILKDKRISNGDTESTISELVKKIREKNCDCKVASFEDVELLIEKKDIEVLVAGENIKKFKKIFFRRVGDNRTLAFMLSRFAKKNNMEYLDKVYECTNEPSKLKQTFLLAMEGVSVPKTYFASIYDEEKVEKGMFFVGFPAVIKISKSKKGLGVFSVNSLEEALAVVAQNKEKEIIFQEFIPNKFDYRILVLGDEVVCAEKRTRTKEGEFRNNVFLGAKEEFLDVEKVPKKLKDIAINASKVANIQVAGVDVVVGDEEKAYVLEVNRSPAFTHDEAVSDEIQKLTDYLTKNTK